MPSEFELIARYFSPPTAHTVLAGGDDAALVAVRPGMELVVSTDMLVAGAPLSRERGCGGRRIQVAGSEPLRHGGDGSRATLGDAVSRAAGADEAWIASFARGFLELAREHDVDLIGGDTTRGPLNICVQSHGRGARRQGIAPLRRACGR